MPIVYALTNSGSKDLFVYGREPVFGPFFFAEKDLVNESVIAEIQSVGNDRAPKELVPLELEQAIQASRDYDIIALDGNSVPISERGCSWLDGALELDVWAKAFAQCADPESWTRQRFSAWMEDRLRTEIHNGLDKVRAQVKVVILSEEDHHLYQLHTEGMGAFAKPELEIDDVPLWWVTAAGAELQAWAAYSLTHAEFKEGSRHQAGGPIPLVLHVDRNDSRYWKEKGTKCLLLSVRPA